jgi:tetratricopeptide (TPR) repeat protein
MATPVASFAQTRAVTYSADIAPIVFEHCAACHRPGGSAGFGLLTYRDARPRARQIAAAAASRRMPPWLPEPGHGEFAGERRLTDRQIALFQRWAEQGAREGDRSDLPAEPTWPAGWERGEPDLVLTMAPYTLRAGGPDVFRNFVIPVPAGASRYVSAWEFRPGNPAVVHHATMQIDTTSRSRRFDEQDRQPGYEGLIAPSARAPDGFFLDWAPGHRPSVAVEGTAWPLPSSSDLVMMLHLRPHGKEEIIQASVGLYFSDTAPARLPVMVRLTHQRLDIPAGEREYRVADSFRLPVDVDAYTIQPHAHYLAREMRGTARLPDGSVVPLVLIKQWDFDWQDVYHYARPLFLPAGTTVTMEYTYDNSAANRRNPNRPPRRVTYGQQTSDEMAELWLQVLPRRDADRQALNASLTAKILPEEINGRRMMLQSGPDDAALHDEIGLMRAELGDFAGAEAEFRQSLRLKPDSAAARYNEGVALVALGRRDEARTFFESALAADSAHARSHYQLGAILQSAGDLGAALSHYREAARLDPGDAEAQLAAGVALSIAGERRESAERLQRALQLRPDWPNAQAAYAWTLAVRADATAADRAEAVRLAGRAVAATGRSNAGFLDILATALAANGQFDQAVPAAEAAVAAAAAEGNRAMADDIRGRLELFRRREAYHEVR